jgi:hypothetical protein
MIAGLTMKSQADYFKGDNIDWKVSVVMETKIMATKIKSTNYLITPHTHFTWQGTRSSDGCLYLQLQGSGKAGNFWTWSACAHACTHAHACTRASACTHTHNNLTVKPQFLLVSWDHITMACSKHRSYRHLAKTIWKVHKITKNKIH